MSGLFDPDAFIRAQTALVAPPLVPEIRLHLATEVTPLWQATEATLAATNLPPPYWAFAWPGGQALARHLLDHAELVRGRRVLDFAAGCGIAGIAAAMAGAARVAASEIDALAAAALTLNARANGVAVAVAATDLTRTDDDAWDVVLAGDVCYERAMTEAVIPWLRGLAARGRLVLLADPGRAYLPEAGLEEIAAYDVPTPLDLEDRLVRRTRVMRLAGTPPPRSAGR
jgi:predicted nicotinamide N-methyase